jgi:uncharacterized protein with HEPN domain
MSRHDDSLSLRQMSDHIEEAMALVSGRKREDLDADRMLFLSLLKLVEIVGEAALRVSGATQRAHPGIPWREITGTRHHLVHGYDAVDCDILWNIVTLDFPPLARQIKALLPKA